MTKPVPFTKRVGKGFLKLLVGILCFIGLYALAAFTLPYITVSGSSSSSADVDIYILTNGVHTDIVMPLVNEDHDWRTHIRYEHTLAKDTQANYIALGWGDKGFYLETPTWADLKASVALKAAFGLSNTAMHTTFYKSMPIGPSCRKITISKEQYAKLIAYVNQSFTKDQTGNYTLINTEVRYGNHDAFYEANGSYSLFYTCNTWANNALKSCEQTACLWTPFDKGIFRIYE